MELPPGSARTQTMKHLRGKSHSAAARGLERTRGARGAAGRTRARAGMTLLEVMIAGSVLVVGFLAVSQAIVASLATADQSREVARAVQAARQVLETLKDEDFATVWVRYNADPGDDPPGAPGPGFAVPGLPPLPDDPDGLVGEIVFPTAAGGGAALREDAQDPSLGMPRDLNGDGAIDGLDHGGDYGILPVKVRLRWRGPKGPMRLEIKTLLAEGV